MYILLHFCDFRWVFGKHKNDLLLADQDILNAIFGYSPWYLYELPCSWNYIIWQCRVDYWSQETNPRTWLGKNQCKGHLSACPIFSLFLMETFLEAEETGVSIIHGNSSSFYILFEEIFRQIYKFWQDFSLSNDRLEDAGKTLRSIIKNVTEMTKYQTGKDDKSPCSKVKNIADIMLQKLENRIRLIHA